MRRAVLFILCAVLLGGCTAPRAWYLPGGVIGSNFDRGSAGKPSPWQVDQRACVTAHDPGRLAELDSADGYRDHGWFLSPRRFAVMDCMRQKGWRDRSILFLL